MNKIDLAQKLTENIPWLVRFDGTEAEFWQVVGKQEQIAEAKAEALIQKTIDSYWENT